MTRQLIPFVSRKALCLSGAVCLGLLCSPAAADDHGALDAAALCALVDRDCLAGDGIAVVNPQPADAILLEAIKDSHDRFATYFPSTMPMTIVWRGEDAALASDLLRDSLFSDAVILPWLDPAQQQSLIARQVESQIRQVMAGQSEAAIDAMIAQAMSQLPADLQTSTEMDEVELGAVQHELGHLWLVRLYENSVGAVDAPDATGERRYGSAMPDWIDEAVAIAMENDALHERRMRDLRENGSHMFIPLADYFTMEHPTMARLREMDQLAPTDDGGSGMRVIVMNGSDLPDDNTDAELAFYTQGLLFSQFLQARAGSANVLKTIADHLDSGDDMVNWLANQSAYPGLPRTVEELESAWQGWLSEQIDAAG